MVGRCADDGSVLACGFRAGNVAVTAVDREGQPARIVIWQRDQVSLLRGKGGNVEDVNKMVPGSSVTYPRFMLVRCHANAVRPTPVVRRTDKKRGTYDPARGEISILETIGPDDVGDQETVVGGDSKWLNDAAELVGG